MNKGIYLPCKCILSLYESINFVVDCELGIKIWLTNIYLKYKYLIYYFFSLGGWSFGTQRFKDMASNRYNRQLFVFSAIKYLRDRDFDGLDLDWEFPRGADDKKNFVLLLKVSMGISPFSNIFLT